MARRNLLLNWNRKTVESKIQKLKKLMMNLRNVFTFQNIIIFILWTIIYESILLYQKPSGTRVVSWITQISCIHLYNYVKVGRVNPIVIWSKFRMGQYRDDDHQEHAPRFSSFCTRSFLKFFDIKKTSKSQNQPKSNLSRQLSTNTKKKSPKIDLKWNWNGERKWNNLSIT